MSWLACKSLPYQSWLLNLRVMPYIVYWVVRMCWFIVSLEVKLGEGLVGWTVNSALNWKSSTVFLHQTFVCVNIAIFISSTPSSFKNQMTVRLSKE